MCRIFDYYNRNIKANEKDTNVMNEFKSILSLISYKSIDLLEIPAEYQQLLFKYGKYFNLNKENEIKRIYMSIYLFIYHFLICFYFIYIEILDVKNILLNTILLEWFINNNPFLLLSEDRKNLLRNIEFKDDISIILKGDEIKYKIMVLIMIIDLNIEFDISKHSRVSLELINTYKSISSSSSSDSSDMKDAICKCLTLFTKDKQSNEIIQKTKDKELISKISEYQSITSKTDFDTTITDIKTAQFSLKLSSPSSTSLSPSKNNDNNNNIIPSPPPPRRSSITTSNTSPSVRRHSAMYMMRSPRLFRDGNNDMIMPKSSNFKSPRLSNPLFDSTRFYACIITSPKYDRQSHYIKLYDNSKYSIFKLTYKITGEKKVEIKYKHKYTEFNNFIAIFFSVDSYICEWKGDNIYTFYNENDEYYKCNNGVTLTKIENIPQIKSDSTYHIVYQNKSVSISINDGKMMQLFSNIEIPVCPCVSLDNYSSIELMSITEE